MHRRRLVGGEVVQHDVDLHARLDARVDVAQERHEIQGAMLLFAPRQDSPSRDVQRGEEVEGAMAEVVVGAAFGLPDIHRQDRLRALQRLDLGFLVEREHHRIVRRVHIQPDDVTHFVHELRIGRQLERARDVGLQAKRAPDAADHRVTHPGLGGHRSRAPVRRTLGCGLQRLDDHGLDLLVGDRSWGAHSRLIVQAIEPTYDKACPPLADGRIGRPMSARHRGIGGLLGAREHEPCPKRERAIHPRPFRQPHQLRSLKIRDDKSGFGTSDRCHAPLDHTRDRFAR